MSVTYSTIMMSTSVWGGIIGQPLYPGFKVKHKGLRVGEIRAWRAWRVVGEESWLGHLPALFNPNKKPNAQLYSMAVEVEWKPGDMMQGDVREYMGIHAWKSEQNVMDYARLYDGTVLAIGTVDLWGEIVEHENGFRAECARISSLKTLLNSSYAPHRGFSPDKKLLSRLQQQYNVGCPE